jgi:hypothetical protein
MEVVMKRWHSQVPRSWLVACTALLGFAGSAFATDRNVPSGYSTIQAAVDAAASGDVIVCAPGTYTEAVVATKSNITIKGTTDAAGNICEWDGGVDSAAKTCIDITGDAVVVTGFKFKNGLDHVKLKGRYCKIKDCKSERPGRSFCRIEGDDCLVERCEVRDSTEAAVKCIGNIATVVYVKVFTCLDVGIDCEGDDSYTRYCYVEDCRKGGIRCHKPGGRPRYCKVLDKDAYACKEFGFHFDTDVGDCKRNTATLCGDSESDDRGGYRFRGDDNWCHDNVADRCKGDGFNHRGDYGWHYGNEAYDCERDGHRFEGNANDCDYARAERNGRDGHSNDGDYNYNYDCVSRDNGDDGYDNDRGRDTRYTRCDGRYNDGAGCENGGTSTDLYSCVFLSNTVDIGLSSSGASFGTLSLNTFFSGSITGILGIGLGL